MPMLTQRPLILALAMAVLMPVLLTSGAAANDRYAAFVVDQDTGVVMHSRRSDAQRHPASLTKMMTLYMIFEAIELGEIGLRDQIRVSQRAASAPPSRLGLSAGDTITVEEAILALIVKSANDVALAVGERLAGGETRFAEDMTERAATLGLESTLFRNASGLPDSRQVTSARDMARLAIALHRDYPQYFDYFNAESFRYGGRTYRNHNSLVGRVEGVDGLKTGYIRASGFNIVVSAERHGHRLIAVVMGGPTAQARDAHAEELLEAAFGSLARRQETQLFAELSSPRMNPVREQRLIASDFAALGVAAPTEMGSAETSQPLRIELTDEVREPGQPEQTEDDTGLPPAFTIWSVQVGAYHTADQARDRLSRIAHVSTALNGAQHAARRVETDNGVLWRARFEALSASQADAACADFTAQGEPCFTVAPGR
ncbi:D-alanyl-D-alanine carboxypeptidase family protein [Maricaulis sp.]|uniref:D-alanyl-D-alanine carboxypeptidase family protein n=1 Tax=Maricaulis sp. TaxID=1486257 RepID=UPI002626F86A|nr:D-alanyl-D-alanine carboxypeptidase family protein [Maricaulis sp.]